MVGRDTTLLESLKRNDSALFNIARDFEKGYSNADTVCFYEKEGASYGPLETKVRSLTLHSPAVRAYYIYSSLINNQPPCSVKEQCFLIRITRV